MKKIALTIFVLISTSLAFAQNDRVINVFYDGKNAEFTVNTEKNLYRSGFVRTNKIVLITNRVSICEKGCFAEIKGESYVSFSIIVAGHKIATVNTNDTDNLLSNQAFEIKKVHNNNKEQLVLNLNVLEKDKRATVR